MLRNFVIHIRYDVGTLTVGDIGNKGTDAV